MTDSDARRFGDKVVLITGGGGAIGKAAARRFGTEGAKLVIFDRNRDNAESLIEALRVTGTKALAVVADVGDKADVDSAVDAALQAFGRIDVLFNNAGIPGKIAPVY